MAEDKTSKIKAVIVLTAICLIISCAVVVSYQLTKPYIERSANKAAYEAIEKLFPQIEGFDETSISASQLKQYGCTFLRKASDGSAAAIQIETNGYQAGLTVMVGINADKTISGVRVVSHGETEGIGTRAMTEEYLGKYVNKSSAEDVELLSGATYTSEGIRNAVKNALEVFEFIRGELSQ